MLIMKTNQTYRETHFLKIFVLSITLFSLVLSVSGQTKRGARIDWEDPAFTNQGSFLQCIGCQQSNEVEPLLFSEVKKNLISREIERVSIESFETAELSELEKSVPLLFSNLIKATPEILFKNTSQRKESYLVYSFIPLVKERGEIRKITSFKLRFEYAGKATTKNKGKSYVNNSVLSSGEWYKMGIVSDGVYKVDYNLLAGLGIDMDSLDPRSIHIYGNGAGLLGENNASFRPDDLMKNASSFVGNDVDGSFDSDDYLLFYGNGPHRIEQTGSELHHVLNHFSDTSFYFIHIDASESPKRVMSQAQSTSLANQIVTSFNDYMYNEAERINFWESGREWYGDRYNSLVDSYTYNFSVPNITADSIKLVTKLASRSTTNCNFTVSISGVSETITLGSIPPSSYDYATLRTSTIYLENAPSSILVNVNYGHAGSITAEGFMDVLELNVRRKLIMVGNSMKFQDINSIGTGQVSEFQLTNAAQVTAIWDITNHHEVSSIDFTDISSTKTFVVNTDSLRQFIAITDNGGKSPIAYGQVVNQNLHALGYADLILISPPLLLSQANDLATFHRDRGTSVNVVTPEEIFNEFSSGMRDGTAIRHFLRMFYQRAGTDPTLIPKHLLLFGDGSYDNKGKINANENLIPTYQSLAHTDKTKTFTSDDYFVILADNAAFTAYDLLDMSVGRLPITTTTEASAVVTKIKRYVEKSASWTGEIASCNAQNSSSTFGRWKNNLVMVSDDEDGGTYFLHTEQVANRIENDYPWININKVHSDAYVQESTPGGERFYGVYNELKNKVQEGVIGVNYIGHGGEVGWATERILDISMINGWSNSYRLPFFMTATCEFSRFDDPDRTSAGELLILSKDGGAIAMFTTWRLVFAGPNLTMNKKFYDTVFKRDADGKGQTFGSIYMGTKNSYASVSASENGRKFGFLGDPALQLALPEYNIVTDKINDSLIGSESLDTLNALGKVKIEGHIEDWTGNLLNTFNGVVYLTVYDKPQEFQTLGNNASSGTYTFNEQNSTIYSGKSTVTNGEFSFTFVAPKDVNLQYGNGKLSYYADDGSVDATGFSDSLVVGGVNLLAATDNEGPQIQLFMNDTNFVFGGLTDESPTILGLLSDSNGINTTGNSIGHDLTAIIDGNSAQSIVLNDYYESGLDTYQSGSVAYQLEDLSEGVHTLELKAWDVYNNSSSVQTEFVVSVSAEMALDHVLNYPNPFTTSTEFMLEHNQICTQVEVQIQIFTVSGRLVKTLNRSLYSDGFRISGIDWNGTDEFGDRLGRGTYFYRVKVETNNGAKAEKFERLVILK